MCGEDGEAIVGVQYDASMGVEVAQPSECIIMFLIVELSI